MLKAIQLMPKQFIVLFPTSENSEVLSLNEVLQVERETFRHCRAARNLPRDESLISLQGPVLLIGFPSFGPLTHPVKDHDSIQLIP